MTNFVAIIYCILLIIGLVWVERNIPYAKWK